MMPTTKLLIKSLGLTIIAISTLSPTSAISLPALPILLSQEGGNAVSEQALIEAVYQQVNQYRASLGLPPLQLDSRISEQEQVYAQTMAEAGRPLNHQGDAQRAEVVLKEIPHKGYRYGENEYYCFGNCQGDPATAAVQWWLNSPPHRQNILGNYELTGIGVAKNDRGEYYFAQMFLHTE